MAKCVHHYPSINCIFSVFSNINGEHENNIDDLKNYHGVHQDKRKLNLWFEGPQNSARTVKSSTVVMFEDTKCRVVSPIKRLTATRQTNWLFNTVVLKMTIYWNNNSINVQEYPAFTSSVKHPLTSQGWVPTFMMTYVTKGKHFPRYWPFVRGIHRSPVNCPHKGQRRGSLMFSLIFARINAWVNNREAGDLRRHRAHYDVILMLSSALNQNNNQKE